MSFKNKNDLNKMIENNYTCKELANIFNVSESNLRYYARKFNLKFNTQRRWSLEEKQSLVNDLNSGMTIEQLTIKYNTTKKSLYSFFHKNNIAIGQYRKHCFDENYFEVIDTEHKAYWLGFIMADGGVCKTCNEVSGPNRLYINISAKDKEHLQKFCEDIKLDKQNIKEYTPIGTYSNNPMVKVCVNSIKLCNDLKTYGIIPNKTGKELIPSIIPNNLIRHFIRGFFDGDGCFTKNKDKIQSIMFCGPYDFLNQLQNIFIENNLLSNDESVFIYQEKRNNKKLFYLRYNKSNIRNNITEYMYNDSTIYLNRKKMQ